MRITQKGLTLALGLLLVPGCYKGGSDDGGFGDGSGGDDGPGGADGGDGGEAPEAGGVGIVGMRRLSRDEFDRTLADLLGDDTRPAATRLPEDVVDPFDNDYENQVVSTVLIEGLETLAIDVADRLIADATRRAAVVGCTPSGATDQACMESFVTGFGRRALRRPLTADEVSAWTALAMDYAGQAGDFYEGVGVVLRTLIQHPQFVYRVEIGAETDEPGVFRLDDYEVATRLSYFVWGSTPSDALLDLAEAGRLGSTDEIGDAAAMLLADPRARDRIDRFHAMWMGYHQLPHDPTLTAAMRQETRRLVEDVIFDNPRSYAELFTASGTFVDDAMAQHYGLPAPGSTEPVWVEYGDSGRAGILSHGSFLSVASKFDDTSPTQRGLLIRRRLLCQIIPPPPPDVNVDAEPVSPDSDCKWDRYAVHREEGACAACHNQFDPVGFGLENYDPAGRFRATEAGMPQCTISGDGDVDGVPFNGPAGLAGLLIDNNLLDTCAVTQVYRLAMGHKEGTEDMRTIVDLGEAFADSDYDFEALIIGLVSDESFMFRREAQ